jgi:predicted lipid-binding transport protein (Tim44 family)
MKRFLMLLTVAVTCLSLFSTIAEAKRFGGGSSFGKQRSAQPQRAQKAPAAAPAPTPAPAGGNKWLGPLAGLAIGAGIMSMFAGGGLGGLGSMLSSMLPALLIGGVLIFLISRFRKAQLANQQEDMQLAGAGTAYSNQPANFQSSNSSSAAPVSAAASANIPQDFPVDSFLRSAKASFIRLQAANDRKDIDDVREYTTPEVFAEIAMQMQERGTSVQKTDVLSIHAQLLEVVSEGDFSFASVHFSGELRENDGLIDHVDEIWNLQRDLRDDKAVWLLAGIQQAAVN